MTKESLQKITIGLPPLYLQNLFAKMVKNIEATKQNINKRISYLNNLFDKKMDEYFGGEE